MRLRSISARRGTLGIAAAGLFLVIPCGGCATAGNDGELGTDDAGATPIADAATPTTTRADASTPVRDSGAIPTPDTGASTADTGTSPGTGTEAGTGLQDAAAPGPAPDAGSPTPPTTAGVCPSSNPTYAIVALALIASGTYTNCASGCSATECCYASLVCVPL